jgi:hypothetical protein
MISSPVEQKSSATDPRSSSGTQRRVKLTSSTLGAARTRPVNRRTEMSFMLSILFNFDLRFLKVKFFLSIVPTAFEALIYISPILATSTLLIKIDWPMEGFRQNTDAVACRVP